MSRPAALTGACLLIGLLGIPVGLEGQRSRQDPALFSPQARVTVRPTLEIAALPVNDGSPGGREFLASALLPGTGQLLGDSGSRRGWVMLGVDLLLWSGFIWEGRAGRQDRTAYRDLAWDVARGRPSPRLEGDFEYYERMTKWAASGHYDVDGGTPGVQPETRLDTFNGDAWRLARALFLGGVEGETDSPAYQAALAYYENRAYSDAFLWDWTGAPARQGDFSGLIRESDDHLRRATWAVAGAIGNRVVSLLDLYITSRSNGTLGLNLQPGGSASAVQLSVRWSPAH